jgi:hypothetical protein
MIAFCVAVSAPQLWAPWRWLPAVKVIQTAPAGCEVGFSAGNWSVYYPCLSRVMWRLEPSVLGALPTFSLSIAGLSWILALVAVTTFLVCAFDVKCHASTLGGPTDRHEPNPATSSPAARGPTAPMASK